MIPVYIVALFAFLVLVTLIVLRLPPLLSAVLWVTVPLALTPLWLDNADSYQWTWFLWLKTWTIMVACAWGALCCALPRIPLRLVAISVKALIAINVAEAGIWDVLAGNWLNGAAAGLLIVAVLVVPARATIMRRHGFHILSYDLSWTWIIGFTIWDLCFTYLYADGYPFGQQSAVLGAALAVAVIFGRHAWAYARALTLGVFLVVYKTYGAPFFDHFDTSSWQDPTAMILFQMASLAIAIAACAQALWRLRSDPADVVSTGEPLDLASAGKRQP